MSKMILTSTHLEVLFLHHVHLQSSWSGGAWWLWCGWSLAHFSVAQLPFLFCPCKTLLDILAEPCKDITVT